jgi:hypothetical protein
MRGRYLLLIVAVVAVTLYLRLRGGTPARSEERSALPPSTVALATSAALEIHAEWDRPLLEPAARDPFAPEAPQPQQPASTPAAVVTPPPPPPPAPPPLGLTFVGRMVAPDGTASIMASNGSDTLTLRSGLTLPNGYRVEAIDEQAVHLSYPGLHATARLDLPPTPRYQTR